MDATIESYEMKMTKLQNIVDKWRRTFFITPDIQMQFNVDPDGMLTVNDIILCSFADVLIDEIDCDVHNINIPTSADEVIDIYINWEFEEYLPKIVEIIKTSTIFKAS